jgi:hypothetical protein
MDSGGSASLDPFLVFFTDAEFPTPHSGSTYTLEILDGVGGVLADVDFDLTFLTEDHREDDSEMTIFDETPFSLAIDLPNGAETVRLRQGGMTLAEVEKSANAPMVAFTDVTAQAGNVLDLEWMASDLDGDGLTYTLFYSPNGVALQSLAVDLDGTTFSFDLDDVTPLTFGGFLRVRASDGWNFAEDDYGIGPAFAVLDVDADGTVQALTDGLLVLRHLFGFTGGTLINGAVGGGCTRCLAGDITAYLNGIASSLNVDGNGSLEALTDGLLALRYLFGFTGGTLINGAVGAGCTRCDATAIVNYLNGLDY